MTDRKKKKPYGGPKCGAKTRSGKSCTQKAGWGTNHTGEGRCKLHGGATPIKTGRYSKINRPRIKELIEQFEKDKEPFNLLPEVQLLRALIQDYIERYDEYTEALILWWDAELNSHLYEDETKRYMNWLERQLLSAQSNLKEIFAIANTEATPALKDALEKYFKVINQEKETDKPLNLPTKYSRPRKIIDILQVGNFIGQISGIVEKINKQKDKQAISMEHLYRVMQAMATETLAGIREVIKDDATGSQLAGVIQKRWETIRIEPGENSK